MVELSNAMTSVYNDLYRVWEEKVNQGRTKVHMSLCGAERGDFSGKKKFVFITFYVYYFCWRYKDTALCQRNPNDLRGPIFCLCWRQSLSRHCLPVEE